MPLLSRTMLFFEPKQVHIHKANSRVYWDVYWDVDGDGDDEHNDGDDRDDSHKDEISNNNNGNKCAGQTLLYTSKEAKQNRVVGGYTLSCGGPMVTDGQYTSPSHRRGGLRPNNMYSDDFRKALLVFTNLE